MAEQQETKKVENIILRKKLSDCGDLNIKTKFGSRLFKLNVPYKIPKPEAEELLKVRAEQTVNRGGCDLEIVK